MYGHMCVYGGRHTTVPKNSQREKVGETMQDLKDFEDESDVVVIDLLYKIERVCYEKLYENLLVGDDASIARAGQIVAVMKAVGLI